MDKEERPDLNRARECLAELLAVELEQGKTSEAISVPKESELRRVVAECGADVSSGTVSREEAEKVCVTLDVCTTTKNATH